MKYGSTLKLALILTFLVAADQLSKYLVRHLGGFYICNKNIAFGIKIPGIIIWILIIAFLVVLIFALARICFGPAGAASRSNTSQYNTLYIILIIAGAFSNVIDRIKLGCIIDFIDVGFWPVFNPADAFITIGIFLFLARYIKTLYN